nr:Chain C, Antibacterial protein PR-39 [Sus scrofa]4EZO_D Chain D, Antibacterial protein PR-39 [Sus scrofa]
RRRPRPPYLPRPRPP